MLQHAVKLGFIMSKQYIVPLVDHPALVDYIFCQSLCFCKHIAIETEYLKRPPTLEEMMAIYLEYMVEKETKEKYESNS
jgi:hypothetical protein